jgi:hypothetical protein
MSPIARPQLVEPDGADPAGRLHHHLEHGHRRSAHELRGGPLQAIHRLEHIDDELGLLTLDHTHGR